MRQKKHIMDSRFAEYIKKYIELKLNLGRDFRVEECIFRAFDLFCSKANYKDFLTQQLVVNFVYSKPNLTSIQYARRYQIIRDFAYYLSAFEPNTEALDPQIIRVKHEHYPAYIFTEKEIADILLEAKALTPENSLRPLTYYTFIGLLVCTGLRVSEAIKLNNSDVNLKSGSLYIRETKFKKSRIVPIHSSTIKSLSQYKRFKNVLCNPLDTIAFFVNLRGKRVGYSTLAPTFKEILHQKGIRDSNGFGPSFGDLRHTFAVRRVLAWYEEGKDVQNQLLKLSTYMGHIHFEDTVYYLKAGDELMAKAAYKFEKNWRKRNER